MNGARNGTTTNGSWNTATGGVHIFVPTSNNATVNVSDIYSKLYTGAVNVTINTALASGTQVGQVDINYTVTGDMNGNNARTFTINANGDINVNQPISLASGTTGSFVEANTHSLSFISTTGDINILSSIRTQNVYTAYTNTALYNSYTSGSITMSAPMGTIYSSVSGTFNTNGVVNTYATNNRNGKAGAINLSGLGMRLGGAISAVSLASGAYSGDVLVTTTSMSVTSGGGVNDGISGVISGKNFTKSGVGLLKLSGGNNYTGTTTISEGTLQLGTGSNIPDNSDVSLTSSGSVLDMNGLSEVINTLASTYTQSVVSSSGSGNYTLTIGQGASSLNTTNTIYNGILQDNIGSGSGSMNVVYNLQNTGTLATLGGSNTYSGLTTLTQGRLSITSGNALGAHASSGGLGTVVGSNAQLQITGSNLIIEDESLTINGSAVNNGALYNNGTTNVWGGTITLGSASTIWNQTGSLTINPASGTAIQSSNFGLTIAGNGSSTISGTIGLGTGTLTTNNGTVTLMTSNSSSGSTTVNSGILNIRNNTSLGTGSVSVLNGATLQLQGGISVANQLTLYGVGNGSLGSLRSMSGDNIYNGNITLSTNTVRINTDANILTINGNISGGSIPLYVGGAGNTIMNGVLSGGGGSITWGTSPTQVAASTSFVKDGGGTVDFVGLNTYTGATVLDDGVLELGANNVIGNSSNVYFIGGRLSTMGYSDNVGTLSLLSDGSTLTLGSGVHSLSFSGLGTLDYKTLTVIGWEGTAESSGTAGMLKVGSSLSLTRAQLDQIKFTYSSATYNTVQLSSGELVPGSTGPTGFG